MKINITSSSLNIFNLLRAKREILLLLLIVAIGSFLRIYQLGTESLWLDEVTSINVSLGNLGSIIADRASNGHAPLYFIMLHYWMDMFGTGEAAVRSLSVVFGILAIPAIYLVGREMFNGKIGLIAGFVSAFSYFHIYYSQEARPYSLMLLLTLLSYYFLIKIFKEGKNWYYPCYFLSSFLLGYTHIYGIFVLASQIFLFCLFWTKYQSQRRKLITTFAYTVASLTPLAIIIVTTATWMAERGFWIQEPSLITILYTFNFFSGYSIVNYILMLIYFLFTILALFSFKRLQGKWFFKKPLVSLNNICWKVGFESVNEILLLLIWLAFPIVIPFIISKITTPIYEVRYAIGASAALYILVAKGIGAFNIKRWLLPVLSVLLIFFSTGLYDYYVNDVKDQWHEAADLVEENIEESDVVVFCEGFGRKPFNYYFNGDLPELGINKEADPQDVIAFVDEVTVGKDRLWLITSYGGGEASIRSYLKDTYDNAIVLERIFKGVQLLLIELGQAD